jgi:hypothetical protein
MKTQIANHKIDGVVSGLEPFTNYNGTITAWQDSSGEYVIQHWATEILRYDMTSQKITDLAYWYISQTTSTLVGRIVRNLPKAAVIAYLSTINTGDSKRITKMLNR